MINAKWCGIIGVTNYKELKMADRIVQLTDEDDNNIFPAAGTMPTGAITTNMLQNNSVTSDKIDFTTISGVLPMGYTTVPLTPGKWLVMAFGTTLAGESATPGLEFYKNDVLGKCSYTGAGGSAVRWQNLSIQDIVDIQSGDTFKINFTFGVESHRTGYVCIRIG